MINTNTMHLSAISLAKSLDITSEEAWEALSQTLGYRNPSELKMDVERGSWRFSIDMNQDIAEHYSHILTNVLRERFNVSYALARDATYAIEPFSGNSPHVLDKTIKTTGGYLGDDGIYLSPVIADEFEASFATDDEMIVPFKYLKALETTTNWKCSTEFFDNDYEPFMPSFHIEYKNKIIPVLIFSYVYVPDNENNPLARRVMNMVEKDFKEALILYQNAIVRYHNGEPVTIIGQCLFAGKWRYTFLCNKHPVEQAHLFSPHSLFLERLTDDYETPMIDNVLTADFIYHHCVIGEYTDNQKLNPSYTQREKQYNANWFQRLR